MPEDEGRRRFVLELLPTHSVGAEIGVHEGAFSAVLLFPLILMGTVVGRAIGERVLPPQAVLDRQKALMAETLEWHEQLSKMERPVPPGQERKP